MLPPRKLPPSAETAHLHRIPGGSGHLALEPETRAPRAPPPPIPRSATSPSPERGVGDRGAGGRVPMERLRLGRGGERNELAEALIQQQVWR